MIVRYLFILFSFFLCTPLIAQPKLFFKSKNISVGTIYMTDNPKIYRVKYYNKGDKPLKIYRLVADCPCTTIEKFDSILLPKKSGYLYFKLDLRDLFPMEIEKYIFVDSDASGETELLKITGILKRKRK